MSSFLLVYLHHDRRALLSVFSTVLGLEHCVHLKIGPKRILRLIYIISNEFLFSVLGYDKALRF